MKREKLFAIVDASAFDEEMWDKNCVRDILLSEDKARAAATELSGDLYLAEIVPMERLGDAPARGDALKRDRRERLRTVDLSSLGLTPVPETPADIAAALVPDDREIGISEIMAGLARAVRKRRDGKATQMLALPDPVDELRNALAAAASDGKVTKDEIRTAIAAILRDEDSRDYGALQAARKQAEMAELGVGPRATGSPRKR